MKELWVGDVISEEKLYGVGKKCVTLHSILPIEALSV